MRQKGRKLAISLLLPPDLWAKFKLLAGDTGASINYCVERVLYNVINEGRIRGLSSLTEHEQRENEKFGPATPVYDGEPQQQRTAPQPETKSVKPAHAPRAQ